MKQSLYKILLLISSCIIALLLSEHFLRAKFILDKQEVKNVQSYLTLHPSLGYLWKGNIDYNDNILLPWADIEVEPLSTDHIGFLNHPEAIQARKQKWPVDIIGLGDSFMHDASYPFYHFFRQKGLFYYNMAMHRHSPPQYNIILKEYAASLKPAWIIYGLYENDFEETIDFENWERSDMDWFTYHSGTWFDLPQPSNWALRFLLNQFKGTYILYRKILLKLSAYNLLPPPPSSTEGLERVQRDILGAHELSKNNDIQFLLVLIPSKKTTLRGSSIESGHYDQLLHRLRETDIGILDLREAFLRHENPSSLYYIIDAHWNKQGIQEGASAILEHIRSKNEIT